MEDDRSDFQKEKREREKEGLRKKKGGREEKSVKRDGEHLPPGKKKKARERSVLLEAGAVIIQLKSTFRPLDPLKPTLMLPSDPALL